MMEGYSLLQDAIPPSLAGKTLINALLCLVSQKYKNNEQIAPQGASGELFISPALHNGLPAGSRSVVPLLQVTFDAAGKWQSLNVVNSCVLANHKSAEVL